MHSVLQGGHAGLTKSYSLIFVFPFIRPYKVLFIGIFDQIGLIKSFFFLFIEKDISALTN